MNYWTEKKYKILAHASVIIGSVSLLLFLYFLLFGPLDIISLQFGNSAALVFNLLLSLLFFMQHSFMIRKKIRKTIELQLPDQSFCAFYSICSGLVLLVTVLFWQKVDKVLYVLETPYQYVSHAVIFLCFLGMAWTALSLTGFDPFGKKQINDFLAKKPAGKSTFIVRGPYQIIRHPFYFLTLVMFWSCPVMTVDRLLFSLVWTAWIIAGAIFEEKDLVEKIGTHYVTYQKNVPMLFPIRIFSKKK